MEILLLKKGEAKRSRKGIWYFESGWVVIVCPGCGGSSVVCRNNSKMETKYQVDLDGNIDPIIECPHLTCNETNYYKLESWEGYR